MKLSIYLLRNEYPELGDFLNEKYRDGNISIDELDPKKALSYESRTFLLKTSRESPRWTKYLESHFDLSDLETTNYSFAHIFRASDRIFAITFGYGHTILDSTRMEPNFGLKVCANSLDPSQLVTLDVRNIDVVTKKQRTNLSAAANILDFGVELDEEWIRYLSGIPHDLTFAQSLSGADSLKIKTDVNLESLAQKCSDILTIYNSNHYKNDFAFLDHYRALKKEDPIIHNLETELENKICSMSLDKISVADPELIDEQNIDRYKIYCGRNNREFQELKLEEIYLFLSAFADIEDPLRKTHIIPLDQDDNPCGKSSELFSYLVCEVIYNQNIYVLSAGTWFRVESDYARAIRERAKQIADITSAMNLIPLKKGETEGAYNDRLASINNWVKLDRNLISLNEPFQRLEVCDVIADNNRLLCIKKMNRSSTLSHLYAQASVSAELLRRDSNYQSQIERILKDSGHNTDLKDPVPTFVISFITEKAGPLWEDIFLFSAIHLVRQARFIQTLGFKVAIAKIGIE